MKFPIPFSPHFINPYLLSVFNYIHFYIVINKYESEPQNFSQFTPSKLLSRQWSIPCKWRAQICPQEVSSSQVRFRCSSHMPNTVAVASTTRVQIP